MKVKTSLIILALALTGSAKFVPDSPVDYSKGLSETVKFLASTEEKTAVLDNI
jgi:hypothetical protein